MYELNDKYSFIHNYKIGLVQSGHHQFRIEIKLILTMIWLKICSLDVKQQSLIHYFSLSNSHILMDTHICLLIPVHNPP